MGSNENRWVATPSAPVRESDILSESILKPVLMLSALTTLPEAPSTENRTAREDGAAAAPSTASSVEVQVEAEVATESK